MKLPGAKLTLRWRTAHVVAATMVLALLAPAGWSQDVPETRFEISLPVSARAQPVTGRLFVMISRVNEPEVRLQSHWFNSPQMLAIDVTDWRPGQAAVIDGKVLGTPLRGLANVPRGEYYVQAVLNVYTRFERADGHVIWAHLDQGEGQQFNKSPGNLFSPAQKLHLDAGTGYVHRLSLTQSIAPIVDSPDTEWVTRIRFRSELLSRFWGQPIHLGAVVLLPRGYAMERERRYPVIYRLAEHSSKAAPFAFSPEPVAETDSARLERQSAGMESGHEFYREWISDRFPRAIVVSFQHPTPFADMSGLVNSVNNGPYGDAVMQELLPYIEKMFRIIREPHARLLIGQASAGRDALNLQLRYPRFFGGAWVLSPWAFDHHRYFALDLYESDDAFVVESGRIPGWARNASDWLPVERHLTRLGNGTAIATFRQLSQHDLVMASKAGGEFGSDDAMMSPMGADGYPKPLWDRMTGAIDRSVADYWAQNYDLTAYAARHWQEIGPHLHGKIHMYVGAMDHFWRNEGVHRFEHFLRSTRNPHVEGKFAYGARKGHWQPATNAELVREMLKYSATQAPPSESAGENR